MFASKAKIVDFSKKIQNLFVDFALFEAYKCIIFSILELYAVTHWIFFLFYLPGFDDFLVCGAIPL